MTHPDDNAADNPRPDELFRRLRAERPAAPGATARAETPAAAPATASPISRDSIVRRHPDVTGRRVGDKHILVPLRRGMGEDNHLYTCNTVGRDCWEALDGVAPLADVAARVAATYDDVSAEQVLRDLVSFIEELQTIGAVEVVG